VLLLSLSEVQLLRQSSRSWAKPMLGSIAAITTNKARIDRIITSLNYLKADGRH
jgi:hypothetical protein